MSFSNDSSGKIYTSDEALKIITENASIPVFSPVLSNDGITGGIQEDCTKQVKWPVKWPWRFSAERPFPIFHRSIKVSTETVFDASL